MTIESWHLWSTLRKWKPGLRFPEIFSRQVSLGQVKITHWTRQLPSLILSCKVNLNCLLGSQRESVLKEVGATWVLLRYSQAESLLQGSSRPWSRSSNPSMDLLGLSRWQRRDINWNCLSEWWSTMRIHREASKTGNPNRSCPVGSHRKLKNTLPRYDQ